MTNESIDESGAQRQGVKLLRWALVVPALVFGAIVPGAIVQFMWEGGTSWLHWIPVIGDWVMATEHFIAEAMNNLVAGACSVVLPALAAPSRKNVVGLIAGFVVAVFTTALMVNALFLSNYYADVPAWTVLLEVVKALLFIASCSVAALITWASRA